MAGHQTDGGRRGFRLGALRLKRIAVVGIRFPDLGYGFSKSAIRERPHSFAQPALLFLQLMQRQIAGRGN